MNKFSNQNDVVVYYGNIKKNMHSDLLSMLSLEELARADQYINDLDRHRFIVTRVMVKKVISNYLNKNIESIDIDYEPFGKPFLKMHSGFHFNGSHTQDVFAIACTEKGKIGIDIESRNRAINSPKLPMFLFTPDELKQFENLNKSEKTETFIHFWTMKEAILKATGEGLSKPMNELNLANSQSEKMKYPPKNTYAINGNHFFVEHFNLPDKICGTVAINAKTSTVQYLNMNELKW